MKEFFESELFENIKRFFRDAAERINNISEPGKPFIIKAFISVVAMLSTLSIAMIVLEVAQKPEEVTTDVFEEVSTAAQIIETTEPSKKELQASILFGLDDEQKNLHLLFVLSLDSGTGKAKIFYLDKQSVCKVNEIEGSMDYHYKNGGVSQLVLAASQYTGIEIDRYLVGDEKAFTNLIRYMGDLEIDVEESISYTLAGLSYIIDKGKQVMTPDMLLKYFVYLCNDTQKFNENLREIFSLFASTLFDCENSQKAQDNFGSVIGFFETNISALDFSENKLAAMKLSHELMLKLEAYNSLAEFNGYVVEE
ncbi:MAG: LCP family protein [Clostridia bacterium]|nr:LCP family protein [Clostridia bacterium]